MLRWEIFNLKWHLLNFLCAKWSLCYSPALPESGCLPECDFRLQSSSLSRCADTYTAAFLRIKQSNYTDVHDCMSEITRSSKVHCWRNRHSCCQKACDWLRHEGATTTDSRKIIVPHVWMRVACLVPFIRRWIYGWKRNDIKGSVDERVPQPMPFKAGRKVCLACFQECSVCFRALFILMTKVVLWFHFNLLRTPTLPKLYIALFPCLTAFTSWDRQG